MAHTQDYIPLRFADFDGWFENLINQILEKTGGPNPAWTHIPAEKVTTLTSRYTAWHTAYEKTMGPHTSVDVEAKNNAKKEAVEFIRPFVAQYLKFDPVTDEDRTAMKLHNRDKHRTPIGVPTTRPIITDLKSLGGFQVEIRFQDEATPRSRAIPYGDNGCLLSYAWGPERITDYKQLTQTQLMTRVPWRLDLPPEAEGKFLSCAARWQNEKAELGRWSDIRVVVVA